MAFIAVCQDCQDVTLYKCSAATSRLTACRCNVKRSAFRDEMMMKFLMKQVQCKQTVDYSQGSNCRDMQQTDPAHKAIIPPLKGVCMSEPGQC